MNLLHQGYRHYHRGRVVQSIDMVAITMEVTSEAMTILTDRCPFACVVNVGVQDELEVLAVADVLVECALTEVVELLQLSSTVGSIVDVYLRITLNGRIVHIIV